MKYELRVNRTDLVDGLTKFRKLVKRKTKSDALLSFDDGMFVVSLDGISIESTADGQFPGLVRIPGVKALTLSKILPTEDPLTFAHDQQRLYVGTFSMPCTWMEGTPKVIQVPADAPLTHLLGLKLKYSDEEISKSGLASAVGNAEVTRRNLERQAAHILDPLGVSLSDLRTLVENRLRHAGGLSASDSGAPRPTYEELAEQSLANHRMLHAAGKCREGSEQHERFMKKMAKWM